MKNVFHLSLIILLMAVVSCGVATEGKEGNSALDFDWSVAGHLPDLPDGTKPVGLAGAVIGISNNHLIIGGGSNFSDGAPWDGGKKVYHNQVYVFKKEGDAIINIKAGLKLPYPVAYSANCTTDKGIVMAGGENADGAMDKVFLLYWNDEQQKLMLDTLPDLPLPLTAGAITAAGHDVYFGGGQNDTLVSDRLYRMDLNKPQTGWISLAELPVPVTHTELYTQSDGTGECLYLAGGRMRDPDSTSTLYDGVYQYDIKSNKWTARASLPYALSAQTGVPYGDSSLLVFSGDRGKTFHATEVLIMKIARTDDPELKKQLIRKKNELQKTHPGYDGNVLAYNTHTNEWRKVDSIPFPGQVTTTAVRWGNDIVIPCGEIRAGIRTPDIIVGRR